MTTAPDYADGLSDEVLDKLHDPLDPGSVKVNDFNRRKPAFEYLDHDTIINQANSIFGVDKWGYEVVGEVPLLQSADGAYFYQAQVRLRVKNVPDRMGVAGWQVAGDTPSAHDTAMSGAVTLALKRAFKNFGPQFGLGLIVRGRGGANRDNRSRQNPRQSQPARTQHPWPSKGLPDSAESSPTPHRRRERSGASPVASGQGPRINLPSVKAWMDLQGLSIAAAISLMGISEFSTGAIQNYMAQEGLSSVEALCARLESEKIPETVASGGAARRDLW